MPKMEVALNKLASFSPSIQRVADNSEAEIKINSKISPSDIPNEVEVEKVNHHLVYTFDYKMMEQKSDLREFSFNDSKAIYSNVTGRFYKVHLASNPSKDFFLNLKAIKNNFEKRRLKDNLKFGVELISAIYDAIRKIENSKENSIYR